MNIIKKSVNFFGEVRQELAKVSWSSRDELIGATKTVILITCIMTIFIGLVDLLLSKILTLVFR